MAAKKLNIQAGPRTSGPKQRRKKTGSGARVARQASRKNKRSGREPEESGRDRSDAEFPPVPIPKVATGIANLDEILHGGLPEKRTTLIKGTAGSGKTVLGLEFLYRSAMAGEPVIFISFEETADAIRQNARATGWDIPALEKSGNYFIWEARIDRNVIRSGEFGLDPLLAVIKGKAEQTGARRIMLDAIDVLMFLYKDPAKEREELYRLHDWLVEQQFTTLLTAKVDPFNALAYGYEYLDYMADCVLSLDMRVANQQATRRLRVTKYRGSGFCSNEYPYLITAQGNIIIPITSMLMHGAVGGLISSGSADLDKRLGGGFHQASSILISGPAGSGKTTLAATFTREACAQGRRVMYVSFEESQAAIVAAMRSPGIDLGPAVENGNLTFHTTMPEAFVPEEHLYMILHRMDQFRPDQLVIDAISSCKRMGSEDIAFEFVVRLVDICKQRGITCLMTNQLTNHEQELAVSGIGISSILDTLITLRYVAMDSRLKRELMIVKSRGIQHSNRSHMYSITGNGIRVYSRQTGT